MAIRLIQGKIGSGKTYYAVNHVLKSYYTWSDELDSWVPKEKDVDVRVYTNIKNMKLGEDLDKFISDAGGLSSFFNNKYQETFCMNSNVIYIIDEAQSGNYFHRKFYDVNVFSFLSNASSFRSRYLFNHARHSMPGKRVTTACRVRNKGCTAF